MKKFLTNIKRFFGILKTPKVVWCYPPQTVLTIKMNDGSEETRWTIDSSLTKDFEQFYNDYKSGEKDILEILSFNIKNKGNEKLTFKRENIGSVILRIGYFERYMNVLEHHYEH